MKRVLLVVLVVVLVGCTGILPGDSTEDERTGTLGQVGNVSYDADLDIDPDDGFSEAELQQFVNRSMARVEVVRGLEFKRGVDVEILTREEYQHQRANRSTSETRSDWNNQVWAGLFIVGHDRDVTQVLEETYGRAVQGYYQPGAERIVIVSDDERPTIRKDTLVHELTHALQDQHFGLDFGHDTRDQQAAYDTLIEGEAELVPALYLDRCEEWSCLRPSSELRSGAEIDRGIMLLITQPYVQGVTFVEALKAEGGWAAIDDAHKSPPTSTSQTIHPELYPNGDSQNVTVPDRSGSKWDRFDHTPVGDTLGEASIFAMLAANDVIEADDPRSYAHPVSQGWNGDQIVPYQNRAGETNGYVWQVAWESNSDAAEFETAYRALLAEHGAVERSVDSYSIVDGPFTGAYRLTRSGDTVTIVHGPTVADLDDIHSR